MPAGRLVSHSGEVKRLLWTMPCQLPTTGTHWALGRPILACLAIVFGCSSGDPAPAGSGSPTTGASTGAGGVSATSVAATGAGGSSATTSTSSSASTTSGGGSSGGGAGGG